MTEYELDQALFVVSRRGRTLAAWSPFAGRGSRPTLFDADRVKYVVGVNRGLITDVYRTITKNGQTWEKIDDPERPGRYRAAFHGDPVFPELVGVHAGVVWQQGEGTPVKVRPADFVEELARQQQQAHGDAHAGEAARTHLGAATVTLDGDGQITVTVPAGTTVVVRTRQADTAREG